MMIFKNELALKEKSDRVPDDIANNREISDIISINKDLSSNIEPPNSNE